MLESGLPELVGDDEHLARFLTQGSYFSSSKRVVKAVAFLPSPRDHETSVSRHGREPSDRLWALGAVAAGTRHLHGAAILEARSVRALSLLVLEAEPPPFHATIGDWPWMANDPELEKAKQKELALKLASAAGEPIMRDPQAAR